jgi:hypothetical protein
MTALHITRLVVLHSLSTSLSAALRCATPDSDPMLMLVAAANNAAQEIALLADEP